MVFYYSKAISDEQIKEKAQCVKPKIAYLYFVSESEEILKKITPLKFALIYVKKEIKRAGWYT